MRLTSGKGGKILAALTGLTGGSAALLGLLALIGYATGLTGLYQWSPIPMAANTALCFLLAGTGLAAAGRWLYERS